MRWNHKMLFVEIAETAYQASSKEAAYSELSIIPSNSKAGFWISI